MDYYWNFRRSQVDPTKKMKVIINLIGEQSDEQFFSKKTGLSIRKDDEESRKFFYFSFYNQKYNKWDQQNIIDAVFEIDSILKKFRPALFIGKKLVRWI
jgi:hypothetical protein